MKGHHKKKPNFYENLPVYLIIKYDSKARRLREKAKRGLEKNKEGYILPLVILHKNQIKNNTIIELVRVTDAKESELEYAITQLGSGLDYIDLEACNTFNEGVSIAKLKYMAGYNHHSKRNVMFNNGIVK